jgi:RNA polymerase sigma-70 factor (sigma-E family)
MINGGPESFDSFVVAELPRLRWRAFVLCGDWYEADDLVQETLVKVYRRWPKLRRRAELGGYVRTTLVRTFLNARRSGWWRHEAAQAELPETAEPAPDQYAMTDGKVVLESALRRLGPRQRAVIMLRFLEDLPVEDTAQLLGITPGTVTSQTHRALAVLRAALKDQH